MFGGALMSGLPAGFSLANRVDAIRLALRPGNDAFLR